MDQRQKDLEEFLRSLVPNVYFQPPPGFQVKYPCIIYKTNGEDKQHADDHAYIYTRQWHITHMSLDPFAPALQTLALRPMCEFNRAYAVSGINHTVYYLYF